MGSILLNLYLLAQSMTRISMAQVHSRRVGLPELTGAKRDGQCQRKPLCAPASVLDKLLT
jgi:hypothetical protein